MAKTKVERYGSWRSPITSDLIVASTIRLGQVEVDGGDIYWSESRPAEGGRSVVVRKTGGGQIMDITPLQLNARTRVHEYGGGDFTVAAGTVYFSNFVDQRLYRQDPGREPRPITPEGELRYADGIVDARRGRLICVREDHTAPDREPVNTIVGLDLEGVEPARVLISGNDFYSSPRLSSDGSHLAWLAWNHPNMPWDGCELWVGKIDAGGSISNPILVAGGSNEWISQPEWSPDGGLYFVSDRSGWGNIFRWQSGSAEPVLRMEVEFSQPQWVFGLSTFAFVSADRIICTFAKAGMWQLGIVNTKTGGLDAIDSPYTEIRNVRATQGQAVFVGGSPYEAASIVGLDPNSRQFSVLRRSSSVAVDPAYLSIPRPVEFPTEDGLTAHGFFYAPRNPDYSGPSDERPPLLVKSHGGPTSAASTALNLGTQYFASRGIAVLDVNYGGSTGYGRAFRERLNGRWGIVDVDDCVNGARYLVASGEADGNRLAISGGSAGGFTTLAALTFRDVFKAGASHYGVGDLEALERDTHKFESHYEEGLIAPYPERRDVFAERSPINFTDRISCPVILFQGLDDKVVPPNQAELMVDALRRKGLPFAYVAFAGEGHGFRRAENIKRALDGEIYFYSRIFGFELADPVDPVPIENL